MTITSGIRWTVFCLLLLRRRLTALGDDTQCSMAPTGALHPVQALLEQFEAGLGCAAKESGDKETHVVTVGELRNQSDNKVTLMLKRSVSPTRTVHLLLSSRTPIRWSVESAGPLPDLLVLVRVSSGSSVDSHSLRLKIQPGPLLPHRPRPLHRWALKRHGGLSSLLHLTRGNRVYIQLGEDPKLPAVCQLQATFLSENYVTSDLQPQEVLGCVPGEAGDTAEVHVVKLHSAGSSLCGSLQVEVMVSLLPPVASSWPQKIVLILSSSAPVNWAVVAQGVRGHLVVHSSHSVSPPYPPESDLTVSTTLVQDLSNNPDLILWARSHGYDTVTSYTEAGVANRFLVQLSGGGPDLSPALIPRAVRPSWTEEQRLKELLSVGTGSDDGFAVQCEDGRLSVTVDKVVLQSLSVPVSAVTLQDPSCQAQSNGSHFLLVFPVISCGTEGLLQERPGAVQYKNMVLLWRDTGRRSKRPLGFHFTCLAPDPASLHDDDEEHLIPWSAVDLLPNPAPSLRPTGRALLQLELFVTESYEERHGAPCVVAVDHRVYVKISAEGLDEDSAQVESCVVSAHSDPKTSPAWSVIRHGCSSEPSLTIVEAEEDGDEDEDDVKGGALRFSFIVRPVYSAPMQFMHCSVRLCVPDPDQERGDTGGDEDPECQGGRRIPPLASPSSKPKARCETRTLTRLMVVTQPTRPKAQKPAISQRSKRLSPMLVPDQEEDKNPMIRTGPVMGIIFASFMLGIGLMVALWCIYTHTGRRPATPDRDREPSPEPQSGST